MRSLQAELQARGLKLYGTRELLRARLRTAVEREEALGPDGRDAWDAQLAGAAMAQVAAMTDDQVAEQLQVGQPSPWQWVSTSEQGTGFWKRPCQMRRQGAASLCLVYTTMGCITDVMLMLCGSHAVASLLHSVSTAELSATSHCVANLQLSLQKRVSGR